MKEKTVGIIGDGLIASHFTHYFDLIGLEYLTWSRKKDSISPAIKLNKVTTILLLISDDSIEKILNNNKLLRDKILIHFSGSLIVKGVFCYHPLMTFSKELYTLEQYQKIPFVGIKNSPKLIDLIPQIQNPIYYISEDQKPFYHALCVLGGNFSNILWNKVYRSFEEDLNLPKEVLHPYIEQVFKNIKNEPYTSLTGPIKRGDKNTIKKNINALNSNLWKKIYKLFNKVYNKEIK